MTRDTRSDKQLRAAIANNTHAYKANANGDRRARDNGATHTTDPGYALRQHTTQESFAADARTARAEAARRSRTN